MPEPHENEKKNTYIISNDESSNYSLSQSTSALQPSETESRSKKSLSPMNSKVGTSLSIRDAQLIDYAAKGMTFQDIAEVTGIDPVVVARRIHEILDGIDYWSSLEMSKIIMLQMQEMMGSIKERMDDSWTDPDWAETGVKMIKTISDHYMKMRELALKETEKMGEAQLRAVKYLMEAAYQPLRDHLTDNYPGVDIVQVDRVFINALRDASQNG